MLAKATIVLLPCLLAYGQAANGTMMSTNAHAQTRTVDAAFPPAGAATYRSNSEYEATVDRYFASQAWRDH
jgi:hypothetical protein